MRPIKLMLTVPRERYTGEASLALLLEESARSAAFTRRRIAAERREFGSVQELKNALSPKVLDGARRWCFEVSYYDDERLVESWTLELAVDAGDSTPLSATLHQTRRDTPNCQNLVGNLRAAGFDVIWPDEGAENQAPPR